MNQTLLLQTCLLNRTCISALQVSIEERLGALDIDTKKGKEDLQTTSFPVLLTQGLESNDFEMLNVSVIAVVNELSCLISLSD